MFRTQCPSVGEIRDFMCGRLPDDMIDAVAVHMNTCGTCRSVLDSTAEHSDGFSDLIRKSLQPESAAPSTNRLQSQDTELPRATSTEVTGPDDATRLNGRYTLNEEVGAGGIGRVCRGFDHELGREVAVKVLREKHLGHPDMERRFTAEAKITGRLQHPGVVPVYGMDRDARGRPFFAMKLIRGRTLEETIARSFGTGSDIDLLRVFLGVCQAVAYAHGCGVIHRDLKPVNIMVGEFGEVQVMDWGLARENGEEFNLTERPAGQAPDHMQSTDGVVLGTISYMPPEQASGRSADVGPRADVFSLGAILLHLLTGHRLYSGGTAESMLDKAVLCETAPALRRLHEVNPDDQLSQLVVDCLARDPKMRPDAATLVERMEAYFQSVDDRLQQAKIEAAQARAVAAHERRARRLTVILSTVIAAGVVIGVGSWLHVRANEQALRNENSRRVTESLAQAELILNRSRERALTDTELVTLAARIESANEVLAAGPVNSEVVQHIQAITTVRDTTEVNHGLLSELEWLRHGPEIVDQQSNRVEWPRLRDEYRALYTATGLGPDHCQASAAGEKIAQYPPYVREALITGIDLWRSGVRDAESAYWFTATMAADPDSERRQARQMLHDGDGEQLIRSFDATKLSADTAYLIGQHFSARGEFDTAARVLESAAACHPGNYWINQSLTNALLMSEHRRADAVRYASGAVATNPDNLRALLGLAQALIHTKDHAAALAACRRAVRIDNGYEPVHYVTAVIQYELEEYDAAEVAIMRAIELADDPDSHSVYGQILSRQRRWAESLGHHSIALRANPRRPEFLLSKATSLMQRAETEKTSEDLQEAERCILQALEAAETSRACTDHAVLLQLRGDLLDDAESKKPYYEQALTRLNRALELEPGFHDAELAMLRVAGTLRRTDVGNPIAARLLQAGRQPGYAWIHLVAYYRQTEQDAAWRETLHRATRAETLTTEQRGMVTGDLIRAKEYEAADAVLTELLAANPDHAGWLARRGQCLRNLGKYDAARALLERSTTLDDTNPGVWEELGMTYGALQLHIEAAGVYARLSELQPDAAMWRYNRGNYLMQQKKYKQAMNAYEEALAIKSTYVQATVNLAQAHVESGLFDDALTLYEHALRLDTGKKWTRAINGGMDQLARHTANAKRIPQLRDGTFVPESAAERIAMASVCQQTGAHDLALDLFRKVVDDPSSAHVAADGSLRYYAACSAIMCAREAADRDDQAEATRLRETAHTLIRQELDLKITLAARTDGSDRPFAIYLRQWQTDPLLESVREPAALEKLDPQTRQQWVAFWDDVRKKFDHHWASGATSAN